MYVRTLATLSTMAAAYVATPASQSAPQQRRQPRQQEQAEQRPVRRRNRFARDDFDVVQDLKQHQRPPIGHAALNSGFAVELASSW